VSKGPSTPATRLLRDQGVPFTEHVYRYEEHGGTRLSARALGVDEHAVVKTLVLEDNEGQPLIVLMHGDREVSLKTLARLIGKKSVEMCEPERRNGTAAMPLAARARSAPDSRCRCTSSGACSPSITST
jgi:Cys-tRNA(Pro) deacylase